VLNLFAIATDGDGQAILPAPLSPSTESPKGDAKTTLTDRRRIFKQIIVKCVLQLLLIETTNELLRNDEIYSTMPPEQLLRLMGVLDHSYQFARMFNEDKDLRTGLWKVGKSRHASYWPSTERSERLHETFAELAETGVE
jgi:brefeldin A-inhibited guanine nucleotide-exchange protein